MLDFIQQLVGGVALGCVYGLIALGFVLIYKATEVVNFAQGDLMMLGGFFAFTFITQLGLDYWVGLPLTVLAMAAFGAVVERTVVRPILGFPQFSIVMVTIGLGFRRRCAAGSAAFRARWSAASSSAWSRRCRASTCRRGSRTSPPTSCCSSS